MDTNIQKTMYIITAPCWKCEQPNKVALITGDANINNGQVYGPESFTKKESIIAQREGVVIKNHHSGTRKENYSANTCPYCNAFFGQHYLFTDYYCEAEYGALPYEIIKLDS